MKTYFGQITGEYLESRVEEGSAMFTHEGRAYDHAMEVFQDYIVIRDSLGREVPIDMENVLSLFRALTPIIPAASIMKSYHEFEDMINNTDILCV